MLEVEPEPNIIIPFDPSDKQSVQHTFHTFGVACQTIAAASKLIDLMPGNDPWIIARGSHESLRQHRGQAANSSSPKPCLYIEAEATAPSPACMKSRRMRMIIPYLAPGEAVTTAFLRTLAQGLGAQVKPEILPDNVLARTPDMLVWWSRPQRRVMFFGGIDEDARKLNGLLFPHPALVFKVAGRDLFVRAIATEFPARSRHAR